MAKSYDTEVLSQKSFYNVKNKCEASRKLKVYFSTPEKGINENTGILLLIAGFGGSASSNVYKKMRERFADEYNLVTLQCDYFGWEFMQNNEHIKTLNLNKDELKNIFTQDEIGKIYSTGQFNVNKFMKFASKYKINLTVDADLDDENIDNFNDMSFMQSIDNITALIYVISVLYNKGNKFNAKKVIVFGHSHGAYLSNLCNLFAPGLVSLVIDNSSWIYPQYLKFNRVLSAKHGQMQVDRIYNYIAKNIIKDFEIRDLKNLYKDFKNECKIVAFQGTTDSLVDFNEKRELCNNINNCFYNEINEDKVDGKVFKSTNHGLDADFLELFKMVMNDERFNNFNKLDEIIIPDKVEFNSSKHKYVISYENIIPMIKVY